ncbi:twinkle protein, mitochondrial-like isoform X2 [Varroa destructor]|uniref:SF4 helicase domain-containing protein n=1 Tax=Varroa destructor TaxID=109461 RepID=A0A7M7K920_VARDE|nr:twinkle protein, mitochondrial-like isoform X2 [Varroa destructor]
MNDSSMQLSLKGKSCLRCSFPQAREGNVLSTALSCLLLAARDGCADVSPRQYGGTQCFDSASESKVVRASCCVEFEHFICRQQFCEACSNESERIKVVRLDGMFRLVTRIRPGPLLFLNDGKKRLCPNEHKANLSHSSNSISTRHMLLTDVSITRIKQALAKANVSFQNGHTCLRVPCPRCSHKSNHAQGYLNSTSGTFICYECRFVAPWEAFQRYLQTGWNLEGEEHNSAFVTDTELQEIQRRIEGAVEIKKAETGEVFRVLKRMGLQRIQVATLARNGYHLSYDDDQPKIILPVRGFQRNLVGLKYLGDEGNVVETFPREEMAGYFYTESSAAPNRAILVVQPADAIFVTQETQLTAVAIESTSRLPITSLPLLEHFDNLTIWFRHSLSEWENAKNYARKLGESRLRFIRQTSEYDRPITTRNVSNALKLDAPVLHKSLVTFSELRLQVYDHLKQWKLAAGIKWTRFPGLNKYLKGHRRGELTVFTGQTGSGKTTFLCEYSLDLLQQGVRTLWGSFEISNIRLVKTLLTQFALIPLENNMEKFDEFSDSFAKLPLYMMRFHGQENIKNVLDTMSHSVYVNDIQHVVLDNLQFMMGVSEDRFLRQDMIVSLMRKFATEHNVHVTLVVHPRKRMYERD